MNRTFDTLEALQGRVGARRSDDTATARYWLPQTSAAHRAADTDTLYNMHRERAKNDFGSHPEQCDLRLASCPGHHPSTAQALPTIVRTIKSRQVRRPIPPPHLILRCGIPRPPSLSSYPHAKPDSKPKYSSSIKLAAKGIWCLSFSPSFFSLLSA